ncbi:MAG: DUF6263 family protein [Gemmataceae bacterium]|nr:DUF6263 family protein [Gemmata sp.]MDW8197309.1 DUF6263 family protein [Gemmataceae bacterium]
MFAVPLVAFLMAAPTEQHTLEWKFKEGDVFYSQSTMVLDQTIEVGGQSLEQKMEMEMVMRFRVKSVKPGAKVVEMTYLQYSMNAANLPAQDLADKFKGLTFTATLDDKLHVTKLEGYDKFIDALSDGNDDLKKMMKSLLPENTLRQSFSQTFLVTPGKPVAVGDKWEHTDKMAIGFLGDIESKTKYQLASVKDNIATINLTGDMTFKAGQADNSLPFQFKKLDMKVEKYTGTHTFDLQIGRVAQTKIALEMSGTMTIEAGGMEVEAKLRQKMTMVGKNTDKNPIKD